MTLQAWVTRGRRSFSLAGHPQRPDLDKVGVYWYFLL